MTALDLDAIRARADAATTAPWHPVGLPWNFGRPFVVAGSLDPHLGTFICDLETVGTDVGNDNAVADSDFIAHAREDVPALIAEVARLRLDLGTISELTVADRPYDWRLARIDEIARAVTDA